MKTPSSQINSTPIAYEKHIALAGLSFLLLMLVVIIALPLWSLLSKSMQNANGNFVGLDNFITYFSTPVLVQALSNSFSVAIITTMIVVPLAFLYAYGLTRSCMPFKNMMVGISLLPIFAPSLLSAISLIYLFGNQGFLKTILGGQSIYGPIGIIASEVCYCFPHAVMIIATALRLSDGRLYEMADALGTTRIRKFYTITLPGARYGLISAAFVVFTLVITDFGIPKVIGGQFNVLATDAYKQIVGQQNFSMGAVVALVLLLPAIFAFFVDRHIQRKQMALLTARSVPFIPQPDILRDTLFFIYTCMIGLMLVTMLGVAIWASFIKYWPYNLSLTLANYEFEEFDVGGWKPYFTSLKMAALVAVFGTALIFSGAYLIEKLKDHPKLRAAAHFFAMLPMAVPGLVLGLGYVFFVNAKWNPLNIFYGTLTVLVVNTIAHFYTVSHITAITALKQIDNEFEAVSESLKVPFWQTFRRVTVPISMPAIIDIAVYMFVNALTTISSVIFLYGPSTKLASIAVVHMDEAGATAAAAGMATCIVITAITAKVLCVFVDHYLLSRLQNWRAR